MKKPKKEKLIKNEKGEIIEVEPSEEEPEEKKPTKIIKYCKNLKLKRSHQKNMMKQLEKTPEEIYEKTGKPTKIVKKQIKENILQKM